MKRLLIGFLVVIISLMMLVSCESDDDDDDVVVSTIVQPPDISAWDFSMAAQTDGRWGDIHIMQWGEDVIESCTLLIDGEEVALENSGSDFYANYPFEVGVSYNFDLTINETLHHSTDLVVPYVPAVNFPETWDGQTDLELTWELEADSKSQSLYFWGPDDTENRSIGSIYILAALRMYIIMAGIHGYTGLAEQTLTVSIDQENWTFISGLIFIAFNSVHTNFGTYEQMETPRERARRVTSQVMKKIR